MAYTNEKLAVYADFLKGKTAAVLGVGISNIPLLDFLLGFGVKVTARDKKSRDVLKQNKRLDMDALEAKGVRFVLGEDYLQDLDEDLIFKGPGLRFDKPEILHAYENGSLITSEMEAFLSLCPATVIAVTGSNGKTTTTTLIAEMLKKAGKTVYVGGNIGKPLLSEVGKMTPQDFAVLELSSFQLHTVNRFENKGLPFAHITFPDVGVITNVFPNHLDWHTDLEEYAAAKRAVFTHMKPGSVLVINRFSDEFVKRFACEAQAEHKTVRTFNVYKNDGQADTVGVENDTLYLDGQEVVKLSDIVIPGLYNVENYMAAALAVRDFVSIKDIQAVATTFGGVPHRVQLIASKNGVRYYNSSIDSSPSRTVATLSCFDEKDTGHLILIMGGYDKHIPFDEMAKPLIEKKCRIFVNGPTADGIVNAITAVDTEKAVSITRCGSFDESVSKALADAKSGDAVILTPASASFDAFNNFEERGERFVSLVKKALEK